MTGFSVGENDLFGSPELPVSRAEQLCELPADQVDPLLLRQGTVAELSHKSITATDISAFSLDAARLAAKVCRMDAYSLAERLPRGGKLSFRLGLLDASGQAGAVFHHDIWADRQESLSGRALSEGGTLVVTDLAADKHGGDKLLRRHQITSALVCPLIDSKGPMGTLGIYNKNRHEFPDSDVIFIESIANLVAISFARRSAEEMATRHTRSWSALMESSDTPMVELTPQHSIRSCNRSLELLLGFPAQELEGRSIYSAFVAPQDVSHVQESLAGVRAGAECARFECHVVARRGNRRRLIWSFMRVADENDLTTSLVGTGIDVTEQHELAERLERTQALADNAVRSLNSLRLGSATQENRGETAGVEVRVDRRRKDRLPFRYKQCLAPILDGRMPTPDMFYEVCCHDLSSRGFSYRSASVPDYRQLLIVLGRKGRLIHVIAEIVHVTPTNIDGEPIFLVGCRYRGRASYDG